MIGRRRIVVVGASQAGYACAAALRGYGFDGDITVIGDESHPPYTRPPLSKGVLAGTEPDDSVFLPAPDAVQLLNGISAVRIDRSAKTVELADGDRVHYDGLVIATGARARCLAPANQTGEITLRGLDDAVELRRRMGAARDVLVVGGGFLGMEVASCAASLGKTVTVVDLVAPLARLGPELSALCRRTAEERGVRFRVVEGGVGIGFSGSEPDRVLSLDGSIIAEADLVVTAVGDVPNVEWLNASGLLSDGALVVDGACRVAPGIVAAGDVVSVRRHDGRRARTPHWWNALSQGKVAAATLLGRAADESARDTPPFFWTEAFGLKVRLVGQLPPVGDPAVIDGSVDDRRVLLGWRNADGSDGFGTVAAVNVPISVAKLTKLARQLPVH
jgi:3-phenylpropionate/trans-cinnamate dioxygenase ferredoxin reductase component